MQQKNERSRVAVDGERIDDGTTCTLVAVCETNGSWAMYPHGWGRFGVRLPKDEAVRVARAILDHAGLGGAAQLGVRLPRDEAIRVARAILDGAA
ncbi:MAG: hypothetical protein ACRDSL_00505 [Pseudonocardiaceae bacterium]